MGCAQEDGKLFSKGKYEEVVGVETSKIEQNRSCSCCMLAFLNKISECNDSRYVFLGCYNVLCNYVLCYWSEIVPVCGSLFLRCFLAMLHFFSFLLTSFYKSNVNCFLLQSQQKWCKKKPTEESPIGRKLSDHKLNNRPDADWLQLKPLAGSCLFSEFFLIMTFQVMAYNLCL